MGFLHWSFNPGRGECEDDFHIQTAEELMISKVNTAEFRFSLLFFSPKIVPILPNFSKRITKPAWFVGWQPLLRIHELPTFVPSEPRDPGPRLDRRAAGRLGWLVALPDPQLAENDGRGRNGMDVMGMGWQRDACLSFLCLEPGHRTHGHAYRIRIRCYSPIES